MILQMKAAVNHIYSMSERARRLYQGDYCKSVWDEVGLECADKR